MSQSQTAGWYEHRIEQLKETQITDDERSTIVRSEQNAAAAEGYHKALVQEQAENKRLREALEYYSASDNYVVADKALEGA